MKKLLLIALILFTTLVYSQKPKVSAVRYTAVTTIERDAFVVPAGEFWRIHNSTTAQNEYWDGDSWEDITAGGEANTASSQGTGTTIFYQKSSVDLQFNAIKSENNLLTVSLDAGTHDVELTVNEANISIPASQISDFDVEVSNNPAVVLNTDKETNATHTGEITGATTLTADPTIISNKTLKSTLDGTEELLINDSGLKKTTLQAIADLSGVGVNGILQKNLSWGESYINNWRDLVLDDGATYFPNNGGYEKGRLHQQGLIPSLHFIPAAVGEGVIYSVGKNRVNDLDVSNSASTYVDEDGIVQTAAIDFARIDYTDGDGAILAEPQSTNLIERSETYGHSYWTKSGATIEVAGVDLVTNGDFATDTDWTKGTNWTISGGKANADGVSSGVLTQDVGHTVGVEYEVTYTISNYVGLNIRFQLGSVSTSFRSSNGTFTEYITPTTSAILTTSFSGNFQGSIDNVSVKEVQGFSAPDGSTNAFKLIEDNSSGFHTCHVSIVTSDQYHTVTFFAKAMGRTKVAVSVGSDADRVVYDLINGTFVNSGLGEGCITSLANGWYKCSTSHKWATPTSIFGYIALVDDNGDRNYTGDGTSGVYIFGAQTEQSSFGTSYIVSNSGTTTTRLADVISGAGDVNTFNSLSGTFKVNIRALSNDLSVRTISINDGTASNAITIGYNTVSNTILAEYIISGSPIASLSYQVSDITEYHDVEFQYALNDFKLLINDVIRATDVSGAVLSADTLDSLDYHNGAGSDSFFGKQKQLIIQK